MMRVSEERGGCHMVCVVPSATPQGGCDTRLYRGSLTCGSVNGPGVGGCPAHHRGGCDTRPYGGSSGRCVRGCEGGGCGMDGSGPSASLGMTSLRARDYIGVGKRVGLGKDGSVIAAPVSWIPACAGKTVWVVPAWAGRTRWCWRPSVRRCGGTTVLWWSPRPSPGYRPTPV